MNKWVWIILGFSAFGIFAQTSVYADEAEILAKLNAISDKQDKILAELESVKSELNVVKVRTTLNG